MLVNKNVLILIEKVNKNYWLPFERWDGRKISKNNKYRKKVLKKAEPSDPALVH